MDDRNYDGSRIIVEYAGQRRDRKKGPKSEDVCFNCRKSGHWYSLLRATDCTESESKGKCFKCGNPGHLRRDCKASRSRSRSRSPSVERKLSDEKYFKCSAGEYEA